jgi:predicted dehydrogenase
MDIGCYAVMISRWLFGAEPSDVVALLERDPEFGTDRLTSALLRFPTGQATFSCASQLVPHQRVHVFGTTGRIEVEIPFNVPVDRSCRIFVDDGSAFGDAGAQAIELPVVNQFQLQAERFAEAVRGVGRVPVGVEEAIANMEVIDALSRSAETRDWQRVGAVR